MPVILLTNDDGIHAPGLHALEKSLADLGEVWTVAPDVERSACGRAVTLNRPLRVTKVGPRRFAVDGTPVDCVLLAFRSLMDPSPKIVVSGINRGFNVGEDLDYSGTVGAAAEAALQGAHLSVAVSTHSRANGNSLDHAGDFSQYLVKKLWAEPRLPEGSYLNVNLPTKPAHKIRWTRQGNRLGRGRVVVDKDPRGKKFYWIAERPEEGEPPPNTDRGALKDECISLSLLTLDRNWQGNWTPPAHWDNGFFEEQV